MKRELIVNAGGQDRTVVVEGPLENGMFQIAIASPALPGEAAAPNGAAEWIDGATREVDAKLIRPGTWSIEIAGRNYLVDLDKRAALQGKVAASVGASEAVLSVEDAAHRRLAAAASPRGQARGEQLRAPIAGKVVKVLVAIGDAVAPGHAVIVLEAMKMENELVSERGGTVKAVHKQAGQAVDTGDLLVELE